MGTKIDTNPTPTPAIARPTSIARSVVAAAHAALPSASATPASASDFFRPNLSADAPAANDPNAAPTSMLDTTAPFAATSRAMPISFASASSAGFTTPQ